MPATYVLIASNTLSSNATQVNFTSIPNTYTDLVLRISSRFSFTNTPTYYDTYMSWSGANAESATVLFGNGSAASSRRVTQASGSTAQGIYSPTSDSTSNTFSNTEIYIPNYNSTTNKIWSVFSVAEQNSTGSAISAVATLDSGTAALTAIYLPSTISSGWASGSSFWLYGIKSS